MTDSPRRPILLVGDDADVCEMIAHLLETRGHTVLFELDLDRLTERCRKDAPAVLVVEAVLPSDAWANAVQGVQHALGAACPPIVMLTGSWFEEAPASLTESVETLVVPKRGDELIALVERYCAPLRG